MNKNMQEGNGTSNSTLNGTLGFRCFYCSQKYLTSQAIAGHQKAHVNDPNWVRNTRHERVFIPFSETTENARNKNVTASDVRLTRPPVKAPVNPNLGKPWMPTFLRFHLPYTEMVPPPNYRPFGQIYLPYGRTQITDEGSHGGFNAVNHGAPDSSATITAEYMKNMRKGTGIVVNQPVKVKREIEELDLELRL